jgi:thiosulfate/3-mercaptopyruvate sulfurtransferase
MSIAAAARRLLAAIVLACGLGVPAMAETVTPLVSPQWLKTNLSDTAIVVLDIRSAIDGRGRADYEAGHIPGAVHSDYDKAGWRVTRNGVPFMLPNAAELEKLIGETGIDEDNHVVIVPAGVHATDFGSAARVYWTLKAAGHPRVSILDGGFAAWKSDTTNPVETGFNRPSAKIFTATLDKTLLAEVEQVEAIERTGSATLLDARPATFFTGKEKAPGTKAYGHIRHAINLDSASFYDPVTNRLRPHTELAAIAARLPAGAVVTYCNTGHWAATNWFVLSVLLGRNDVTLYDGSMVEWTAGPRRPVESARTRWDDLKRALGRGS